MDGINRLSFSIRRQCQACWPQLTRKGCISLDTNECFPPPSKWTRRQITEVSFGMRKTQAHYFFFLLFALLWYLGDLIKDQEPAVQGAAQAQIKSTLQPPGALSFRSALASLWRTSWNCCLAHDSAACQQPGLPWRLRSRLPGRCMQTGTGRRGTRAATSC